MRRLIENPFIRHRVLVMLVTGAVLVASCLYGPYVDRGPVVCLSHGLFGIPCPACGLTHAFCDLAHGQLVSAAAHNLVAFPLAVLFILAFVLAPVELLLGRRLTFYRFLYSTRLAFVVGGVLAVYHVTRTVVYCFDGRLFTDYVASSWTYGLFRHFLG